MAAKADLFRLLICLLFLQKILTQNKDHCDKDIDCKEDLHCDSNRLCQHKKLFPISSLDTWMSFTLFMISVIFTPIAIGGKYLFIT